MDGKTESNQGTADAVLEAVLLEARRAGRPVQDSLRALRKLQRLAEDLERARGRLLALYRGRLSLAALVVIGARVSLAHAASSESEALSPTMDLLAMGLAGALAMAVYAAFARSLPRSWLVSTGLTPDARVWLRAHVLHHPPRELACHSAWHALRARELSQGLDLTHERRHLLEAWAEDRSLDDAFALRRAEDRLPLAELVGLGLPLLLALLAPALGALASSR